MSMTAMTPALLAFVHHLFDTATRRTVRLVLHAELTLLVVIMLCAALMARGVGFIG